METFRVAVATDNGKRFVDRHFGDAEFYDIYQVSSSESEFVRRVANVTEEEDGHADPKKARGIVGLLRKEGVQVGLTRKFGPNIKRIKSKLVCVLTGHEEISQGLEILQWNFDTVVGEWKKGEERDFLDLRKA